MARSYSIFDSIAKLLNAKSYYYFNRNEIPNRNVKYAIDCLKENKLLMAPLVEKSEEEYLALYEEFCDEYDARGRYLSRLALHTYFQIPLTPVLLSQMTYFQYLAQVLGD